MIVSIIIPIYNVEQYIGRTLNSLIQQSNNKFEIIIVDDGSTDNSYTVAKKIMEEQKKIKYKILRNENRGVSYARNRGLEESEGAYVVFIDGDDFVSVELVENISKEISEKDYDVICWGYNIVTEKDKVIQNFFEKYNPSFKIISGLEILKSIIINQSLWICTGSAAIKKSLLLKYDLKYTEGCSNGEDQEFTYKLLSRAKDISFIKEVLSFYLKREGSVSNSFNVKRFDVILAMKRTTMYFDNMDHKDIKDISNYLINEHSISNFISNFNACLNSLSHKKNVKNRKKIIYKEIEENYLGLIDEIFEKMKKYRGNYNRLRLTILIFLLSPELYNSLFLLKSKIKLTKYKI